jgi:hypothetical protein
MKKPLRLLALSVLCIGVWIGSVHSTPAAPPAPPLLPNSALPPARATTTPVQTSAKPITAEEAKTWAVALQRAVRRQDVDAFNTLVDWDAFVEKATALPGNSPQLKEFRTEFSRGLKSATTSPTSGFGRAIMSAIQGSGDYRAFRIHSAGGQTRVLFRLISSTGALNYHDWVLGRSKSGAVVGVECYIFLVGEMYSQNLRRSFLPLAHKSGGASIDNLSGPEKDFVEHFGQFALMGQYTRERNWRQALNIYKELPASVQESKPAMTMRLLATQSISDAEYLATIDDFRKHYPNDPMIDLISVDAYILRKSFDKALEAIERVDKAIGGDPYLNVLRGNVLLRENKLKEAREMVQNALVTDPNLLRAYYALIDISLAAHNYADTVKWLKKAESLGVTFGDLTAVKAFEGFAKSREYKEWLQSHGRKP